MVLETSYCLLFYYYVLHITKAVYEAENTSNIDRI